MSRGSVSSDKKQKGIKTRIAASTLTPKQRQMRTRSIRLLGTILVLVLVFCAGFLLRGNTELMYNLGVISSVDERDVNPGATVSGNTYDSISARVAEVQGIIENYSLNDYDLTTATTQLISAFINTTGDKYIRYYSPERYAALIAESSAQTTYSGIGVLFGEYNGSAYAVDVFEGSVAQYAGVQEGDFVAAINGDKSQSWSASEVAKIMSANEGQTLVITWRRPASREATGGTEFTTTLTCKKYEETNVSTEMEGTVGYINIKQISSNAASLISKAIAELEAQGAVALVLDLRDVPGGYFSQACDIADLFIKTGVICQIRTVDGVSNKNASAAIATERPLVVLVNGNTSGSAEVLASALQENNRATIVGEKTMGKGSVQIVRELSFGGALRYTAAYYLTSLGHDIDGVGVSPDYAMSDETTQKRIAVDTALSLA